MKIRKENENDYNAVETLIRLAFENEKHSDHKEHLLVSRLRKSDAFIPELSLVADDGIITGHILFTKLIIGNGDKIFESLALAPVSVLPQYQKKGIGSSLILEGHRITRQMGYKSIIVLGHKDYYPRFGYEPAVKYNIKAPFNVPDENYMIKFLDNIDLDVFNGKVIYPGEFFE
ncbi:MAG: N-acetyltransferase [Brevinematales bacterium]|jgi:predicted N-acetyltransferase YhbS